MSWLIGKDPDAGRDWGQEKGTTEDEMAGWHHRLNAHEFGWTLGVGDGRGGLACCDSWGRKESDTTERPNWTEQIANSMDMSLRKLWVTVKGREAWRAVVHWVAKSQTQFSDWTTTDARELIKHNFWVCLWECFQKRLVWPVLAHMIMGAEKSHSLPSANWRPRKGGGVSSSLSSKAWESKFNILLILFLFSDNLH